MHADIISIAFYHLLFLGILALLAALFSWFWLDILGFYYNRVLFRHNISRQGYQRIEKLLSDHFSYFRELSPDGRSRFIKRVVVYSKGKTFVGMGGMKVTRPMELLISASAVQLTFGLKDFTMRFLEEIRVYPEPFVFGFRGQSMKGAVSPRGFMLLSWKDFLQGYRDDNDNLYLGLHEMAHALKLGDAESFVFDLRFGSYIQRWLEISRPAFQQLRSRQLNFLRAYGGTNKHEFFAVCVEHFFESPEEFAREVPDVFNHLCKLLNQNPLNERGDYELTEDFKKRINVHAQRVPVPIKFKNTYPESTFNRFYLFTVLSILFCSASTHYYWENTLVSPEYLVGIGAVGLLLVGGVQWKYLFRRRVMKFGAYPFYAAAIVLFSVTLYLFLNQALDVRSGVVEHHKIVSTDPEDYYLLLFENDAYKNQKQVRAIDKTQKMYPPRANGVAEVHFGRGAMGLRWMRGVRYGMFNDDGEFVR